MNEFGLIGKLTNKGKILGFFVVDSNGKQMLITKENIYKLAAEGHVANWEVVTDEDGEKHLYSEDISLVNLPNMLKESPKIVKIANVIETPDGVEYICIDDSGIEHKYKTEVMWSYAKQGIINGVTAKKFKGKRVLDSDGKILRQLRENNTSLYEENIQESLV